MNSPLEVFSDLSERLHYNDPEFPLYIHKDILRRYGYAAACHWHPDLEFILILDGSMDYFINGKFIHVDTGHGIFVNSRRLHYGFSENRTDCTFIAIIVHPVLLLENSRAVKKYLEQKFGSDADDFIELDPGIAWQRKDLRLIHFIFEETDGGMSNLLRLLAQTILLCADLCDHIQQNPEHCADDLLLPIVFRMTEFVHRHYDSKITLDDIAASGAVCRSRCCALFQEYVGQAPNAYLTRYRVTKNCEMLRETDRTVCEIAAACGFQSTSYFSYVFRKEIGTTPQSYRKESSAY